MRKKTSFKQADAEKFIESASSQTLNKSSMHPHGVHSDETLNELVSKVESAQKQFSSFTQEQVDKIVFYAALAANKQRINLAKAAVNETQMGVVEDKVIKNHFAAEFVYNKYREAKTCDTLEYDAIHGIQRIAEPVGIVAAVIPITNPTSTVIFKALLALKTRNGIIFSPHPKAKKCTILAAKIIYEAALSAGAPKDIIGWIDYPSLELTQALMCHPKVHLILATGGPGMVKAAYSSGKPAIGVGAGNTPAVVDETADMPMTVSSLLLSKTFDNGTICASEQSVIIVDEVYDEFKKELIRQGGYILDKKSTAKVREVILVNGALNINVVGKSVAKIAETAGIDVPKGAKILAGEVELIAPEEPFSHEKLSPILAIYHAKDFYAATDKAEKLVQLGGVGHTAVLYTHENNQDRINYYGEHISANRILINTPSSQGAIGDIYNFRLMPSLTLGTGTYGGNIVSENIAPKHLLNIKVVATRRENTMCFSAPGKIFFKRGCLSEALESLKGHKKAFIVTDRHLFNEGYVDRITAALKTVDISSEVFCDVVSDADLSIIKFGYERMVTAQPDVVIALGGGSVMDAAKIICLLYEQPGTQFKEITMRFLDIRKRIVRLDPAKRKVILVAIPTTSGTGSEVTPFAAITDEHENIKYPVADYSLLPNTAIIDPDLVMNMPKRLTATSGVDAIAHALEAVVATTATEYTTSLALEALQMLFKYLPMAYKEGANNPTAREKVHYAATMAGMAFANAYLGLAHSMAHKLGSTFKIPHGIANAIVLPHIIRFNATAQPWKQGLFPQYRVPEAVERYANIATVLNLSGATPAAKVEHLIAAITSLTVRDLELPISIKALGIDEKTYKDEIENLAEQAFDDQCTGTNPRYPLIDEIKELFIKLYEGK